MFVNDSYYENAIDERFALGGLSEATMEGLLCPPTSASAGEEPQLCALLVTDLVEFTATVHRLGDVCAQQFIRSHDLLLRACLRRECGTEVAHTGDGMIASFADIARAIHCAAAIQHAAAKYNAGGALHVMHVRIGLHAGRPRREDNRLFGTCVNTTVRVCAVATGQQVLISHAGLELVQQGAFPVSNGRCVSLKGLPDPIRVYELEWRSLGRSASSLPGQAAFAVAA
jgi:class 3 adenylate cyclase